MQFEFTLTPSLQRSVAIALAILPVAGVIALLAAFISGQVERHQQTALLVRQLSHERAVLARTPEWNERLAQVHNSPKWQGLFVGQGGRAAASIVSGAGGKLERASSTRLASAGASETDEYLEFSVNTVQLAHILQSLRRTAPVFVIRSITIQSSQSQNLGVGPNLLKIQMTVAEFEHP